MSDYDPLDLTGQDQRELDRMSADERRLKDEIGDVVWLMSAKRGRRNVCRLLDRAGVFRLSLPADNAEATHVTAFNEGQRNIGLWLLAIVTVHCADNYALMLKESKANG